MIQLLSLRISKLLVAVLSPIGRSAFFRHRVLAAVEHLPVLRLCDFRFIVDVGANRGQFSLAAKIAHPTCRVIAFEPLEEAAAVFGKVFSESPDITLKQHAIGNANVLQSIHISEKNDSSSLLPIGTRQVQLYPNSTEVSQRTIQVKSLPESFDRSELISPALLKIDVQGFEKEVIDGCGELLSSFDYIYCECSFVELYESQPLAPEIISTLADRGFLLQGVYCCSFDGKGVCIQADLLFKRNLLV